MRTDSAFQNFWTFLPSINVSVNHFWYFNAMDFHRNDSGELRSRTEIKITPEKIQVQFVSGRLGSQSGLFYIKLVRILKFLVT